LKPIIKLNDDRALSGVVSRMHGEVESVTCRHFTWQSIRRNASVYNLISS